MYPCTRKSVFDKLRARAQSVSDSSLDPNSAVLKNLLMRSPCVAPVFSCDGHAESESGVQLHVGQYMMVAVSSSASLLLIVDAVGTAVEALATIDPLLSMKITLTQVFNPIDVAANQFVDPTSQYTCCSFALSYLPSGYSVKAIPEEHAAKAWEIVHASFKKYFTV